jgi:CSLREA domain-containing protein
MKTQKMRFLLAITLMFSSLTFSTIAHAATLTVNSLADNKAIDGSCTLREAIENANNNAATNADCAAGDGADTITFGVSGTITLVTSLPAVTDAAGLALDGSGQAVTISGNHVSKIAIVPPGATLSLSHLTIANGYSDTFGGAISNSGTLVITNSVFSGNDAYYYGGGISNSGTLTIANSTFSGNTAGRGGGGIYLDGGTLTITSSTFSSNSASGGEGGGISVFSGSLTITDSTFSHNSASLGSGGGIYNTVGTLTITNSTFLENTSNFGEGGGIYNNYSLTVKSSTFTSNGAGSGGGIFNSGSYLTVANCTFSGNNASANGGGVLNTDHGDLIVVNSTFSGNSASGSGGSINNISGNVTLRNTIVANSVSGGNCSGAITNGGSNLDDGATCGWDSAFGSMSNTNPMLGGLSGSPAYFPLDAGSPAIDHGDDPICAATPVNNQSQNGITRPQGAHCDMGSYEYVDSIAPVVQMITRADPNPVSAASVHFNVIFSEAVTGVDKDDFALATVGLAGATITDVSGGPAAFIVTVYAGRGAGTIRLDVVDNDTIVDFSLNPLGGVGVSNGNFTSGETYDVYNYPTFLPLIFKY